jgi:hypothetical protein
MKNIQKIAKEIIRSQLIAVDDSEDSDSTKIKVKMSKSDPSALANAVYDIAKRSLGINAPNFVSSFDNIIKIKGFSFEADYSGYYMADDDNDYSEGTITLDDKMFDRSKISKFKDELKAKNLIV